MTASTRTRPYTYVEVLQAVVHALKRPNGGAELGAPIITPWGGHPSPNMPVEVTPAPEAWGHHDPLSELVDLVGSERVITVAVPETGGAS